MSERERLPGRRRGDNIAFRHDGIDYIAGISHFEDGRLAEVFFHSAGHPGSGVETFSRDAAVVLSIALQRGATVAEIRHSLVKLQDGSGAGAVGKLLDLVALDAL